MVPETITVHGIIRTSEGSRCEGALVEAYLVETLKSGEYVIHPSPERTTTSSFGTFFLQLALPADVNATFYRFKIVHNDVFYYIKRIPEGTLAGAKVPFNDLQNIQIDNRFLRSC